MSLRDAIRRLAAVDAILVVSDYDGTLAPIVENPAEAYPNPGSLAALIRLAGYPNTSVAILSGRRREQLGDLVGWPPGVALVGEHGSDWDGGTGPDGSDLVPVLTARLEEIAREIPGAVVEPKRWSVAFHYRSVDPARADDAVRRILNGPALTPGVTAIEGKMVVELRATDRAKGDALAELRQRAGADAVLFIGDDKTDESAFARLGPDDVGVKVGSGDSAAKFRVADTEEVVELLDLLAAGRRQ